MKRFSTRFSAKPIDGKDWYVLIICIISGSVFIGLSLLLAWHAMVVSTSFGTLELMDRCLGPEHDTSKDEDYEQPLHMRRTMQDYPFNLGWVENWKQAFDVTGGFWWCRWILPPTRPRHGNGYCFPHNKLATSRSRTLNDGLTGKI